jgi:arabinofuranosyltransferase
MAARARSWRPAWAASGLALAVVVYLVLVGRYWRAIGPFVVDDAFIFLRYARNLAHGDGLVFNPGERVEGYTSVLWTLLLGATGRLGLPYLATARVAGVLLGLATMLATWLASRRLFPRSTLASLLPVALLAVNRTFCVWSVEALETHLFGACVIGAWLALLRFGAGLWRGVVPVTGIVLGLAALARPEGYLVALVAMLLLVADARARHEHRGAAVHALALALIAGGHLAFRVAYYGDLVPNTFHAKVPGLQLEAGLRYVATLAWDNHWLVFGLLPLAGGVAYARERDVREGRLFAPVLVAAFIAYWVAIGGDYFEFRFLAPLLPLVFVMTARGALELARRAAPAVRPALLPALALLALGASLATVLFPFEGRDGLTSPEREAQFTRVFTVAGRWLAKNLGEGESIAVRTAGVIPFLTHARSLDLLGLNDREIARTAAFRVPGVVGHQMFVPPEYAASRGYSYYVGQPRFEVSPGPPEAASVEVTPGVYFVFLPLAGGVRWPAGVYPLGSAPPGR